MKAEQVAELFVEGHVEKKKAGTVRFEGRTYYSYHAPIGYRISDCLYLVKRDGYSPTTKRHVRQLISEIPRDMLVIYDKWDGYPVKDPQPIIEDLLDLEYHWTEKLNNANRVPEIREAEYELGITQKSLDNLVDWSKHDGTI
jgi:hypothetical protein